MAAEGMADKEIANTLNIGEFTAKKHLQDIRIKLGAKNRTHSVSLVVALMVDSMVALMVDRRYAKKEDLRSLTYSGSGPQSNRGRQAATPVKAAKG